MHQLFDSHCHLIDLPSSDLSSFLTTQTHLRILAVSKDNWDWSTTLELAQIYDNVIPALGIHPWYVSVDDLDKQLADLTHMVELHSNICVLGEIGLDFSADFRPSIDQQIVCFDYQIKLAAENDLSVSIHCIKAYECLLPILEKYQVNKVCLHGFSGSYEQAHFFIQRGYKLGIGPLLLNDNAKKLRRLVHKVPIESLLLESDAPYANQGVEFSHEHRLIAIGQRIADIKQITLEEVIETTYDSAQLLFGRKRR